MPIPKLSVTTPSDKCQESINSSSTLLEVKSMKKDAQTLTDSWINTCQKCHEVITPSTTCDSKEYAKAINYINYVHALLNKLLTLHANESKSTKSWTHFKMPDLPNFLTLFSSLTGYNKDIINQNTLSQNNVVSKSTSMLCNSNCMISSKSNTCITETIKEECDLEINSNKQFDCLEEKAPNKEYTLQAFHELVFDSHVFRDMAFKDSSKTNLHESETINNQPTICSPNAQENKIQPRLQKNTKWYPLTGAVNKDKPIKESYLQDMKKNYHTCIKPPLQAKINNSAAFEKQHTILERNKNCHKQFLSDAELNRYASELLIQNNLQCLEENSTTFDSTMTSPIIYKDTSKTTKNKTTDGQIIKKKPLQKLKDPVSHINEEQTTAIPIRQTPRLKSNYNKIGTSQSSSNSTRPDKLKHFTHQLKEGQTGIPTKQTLRPKSNSDKIRKPLSNSVSTRSDKLPMSNSEVFTVKRPSSLQYGRIRTAPIEGLTRSNRPDINKHKNNTNLNINKDVRYQLGNTTVQSKIKNTTNYTKNSVLDNQPMSTFKKETSDACKTRQHNQKKTPYKVKQREKDDLCRWKNGKPLQSLQKVLSNSVILSDKEESPEIVFGNNSDIDECTSVEIESHLINSYLPIPKFSRDTLTNPLKQTTYRGNNTEEYFKNLLMRNQNEQKFEANEIVQPRNYKTPHITIFQQTTHQSKPDNEIVNVTNPKSIYLPKQSLSSDSNSNASNTTTSSDIKSDDYSPVQVQNLSVHHTKLFC